MTPAPGASASTLSPFSIRSFRFQWPADLLTSWAFEMEALILGWYVLTVTGSVRQLVLLGALVWLGTLFSPLMGAASDRLGVRTVVCSTRGTYALLAAVLAVLSLSGALVPWHVFAVTAVAGLIRPSDLGMRHVLVGQTMRPDMLIGALGISRTTNDTAKVAAALAGTGGVALFGMGPVYVVVTVMYAAAFLLSLGVTGTRPAPKGSIAAAELAVIAGVKQAVRYVWHKPDLLGAISMAFLINLVAFPFGMGLLPYAAKDVFEVGQAGLGYLAAAFSIGALLGSLVVGAGGVPPRAARVMLVAAAVWFAAILLFGQTRTLELGLFLLFAAGFFQSFCVNTLAAVILRATSDDMRGRVMGLRMLAIWGLPLGLLLAGHLITRLGFSATTLIFCGLGIAATFIIGYCWRRALWHSSAPANAHL